MSLKFDSLHSWCHFSAILLIPNWYWHPPCPVWYPEWWRVWGVTRWRDVPWHEPRDNMHVRAVLRLSRVTCHVSCVTGTLLASSCCIKPLHCTCCCCIWYVASAYIGGGIFVHSNGGTITIGTINQEECRHPSRLDSVSVTETVSAATDHGARLDSVTLASPHVIIVIVK